MSFAPLPPSVVAAIAAALRERPEVSYAARKVGVSRNSVYRHLPPWFTPKAGAAVVKERSGPRVDLPRGRHEKPVPAGVDLPEAFVERYEPHVVTNYGTWLILSDVHIPYHDRATLELAVVESRKRNVVGVLLNGDLLDSHEISDHDKDPGAPRYVEEIEKGRQFLAWLRDRLPDVEILAKVGNHERRLEKLLIRKVPALHGLEGFDLPSLLHFADHGVEWIGDKRVVKMGGLSVAHGDELGAGGGINPARGLYLKTHASTLVGHWHRISEHYARAIDGTHHHTYTTGCACGLSPKWLPVNDWSNGFAFTDVLADGGFRVDNLRVRAGKIV